MTIYGEGGLRIHADIKVLDVRGRAVLLGGPDMDGAQWIRVGDSVSLTLTGTFIPVGKVVPEGIGPPGLDQAPEPPLLPAARPRRRLLRGWLE